tara:strand:- start:462 stop:830 length:369 start_codon:yes stop_codon:yes gene_type:complete
MEILSNLFELVSVIFVVLIAFYTLKSMFLEYQWRKVFKMMTVSKSLNLEIDDLMYYVKNPPVNKQALVCVLTCDYFFENLQRMKSLFFHNKDVYDKEINFKYREVKTFISKVALNNGNPDFR